jgi:hypothetical protein
MSRLIPFCNTAGDAYWRSPKPSTRCTIICMEPNAEIPVMGSTAGSRRGVVDLDSKDGAVEGELTALLRALTRHGLTEGDWVCSLRTRVTGQLALERRADHPRVVVRTDLGCLGAAIATDTGTLAEWQRCSPGYPLAS